METLGNQYDNLYDRGIRTILPLGEAAASQTITGYANKFGNEDPLEKEVNIEEPYESNGFGD